MTAMHLGDEHVPRIKETGGGGGRRGRGKRKKTRREESNGVREIENVEWRERGINDAEGHETDHLMENYATRE